MLLRTHYHWKINHSILFFITPASAEGSKGPSKVWTYSSHRYRHTCF